MQQSYLLYVGNSVAFVRKIYGCLGSFIPESFEKNTFVRQILALECVHLGYYS